jgi:hypothetical protein
MTEDFILDAISRVPKDMIFWDRYTEVLRIINDEYDLNPDQESDIRIAVREILEDDHNV